jgi:S1-C subfamily serine protease
VSQVTENTAAAAAGVEVGDIIVSYQGKPVHNFEDLRELIAVDKAGDTVKLQVARGGEPLDTLIRRNEDGKYGFEAQANSFGIVITKIEDESVAAQAGFRVGDVLVGLGDKSIDSLESFQNGYAALPAGTAEKVQFYRGAKIVSLEAVLGEWE